VFLQEHFVLHSPFRFCVWLQEHFLFKLRLSARSSIEWPMFRETLLIVVEDFRNMFLQEHGTCFAHNL